MTLPAGSFDYIIANNVLAYTPDYRAVLKKISQLLKVGGLAFIQVHFSQEESTLSVKEALSKNNLDPTIKKYIEEQGTEWFFGQRDFFKILHQLSLAPEYINVSEGLSQDELKRFDIRPSQLYLAVVKNRE